MHDLSILSIFRQSESYLNRYFSQINEAFSLQKRPCHAIWLEGDSTDSTFSMLLKQKEQMEEKGHTVTLIKHDTEGPYWSSRNIPQRWNQLANCWNKCRENLTPTKIAVCVESDLIWDASIINLLAEKLNEQRHVIYPMLMLHRSPEVFGTEWFNDVWGFSRGGRKFKVTPPYWPHDRNLLEDEEFLEITTGGGMIISSYDHMRHSQWDPSCCILKFEDGTRLFMNKKHKIFHPMPKNWNRFTKYKIRLAQSRDAIISLFKKQ
jgi:hypothetical protein